MQDFITKATVYVFVSYYASPLSHRVQSAGSLETRQNGVRARNSKKNFVSQLQEFYPYCIEDTDKSPPEKIVLRINLENEEAENFKNHYSVVSNNNGLDSSLEGAAIIPMTRDFPCAFK
ncbi:hypothetical protein TNCV_2647681 [Trichonephila clavipes]|nr:hypothetical protein TNCV_2647681 [Trichonephila clavipes]